MKILDFPQGSPEWKAARAGRVTASKIKDIMAKGRGNNESAARRNYRNQLVVETLTGQPADDVYVNAAMQWGKDQEPFARAAYEVETGLLVDQVGLVLHPTMDRCAASPDGLIGLDGCQEIKCPSTSIHLEWMLAGVAPEEHHYQMLWVMDCCERDWCDFMSFDPRLPGHLQRFIVRFPRDQKRVEVIQAEVEVFLQEVDEMVERLHARGRAA